MLSGEDLRQLIFSLLIFAVFLVLAFLFRLFLKKIARKFAQKTAIGLDDVIISALKKPVTTLIVLAGLYLAIPPLPLEETLSSYLSKGLSVALSLMGIYIVVALANALNRWYADVVCQRKEPGITGQVLRLARLVTIAAALVAAVLVILGTFDIVLTPVTDWLAEHGWRIALVVGISLVIVLVAGRFIPPLVAASLARHPGESKEEVRKRANTLSGVLVSFVQIVALLAATFTVLSELKIDITSILAGAGVAGIAIGFGAQSLIRDYLGGLFILLEDQYHVGDVVKIAGIGGLVEEINLRRTVLRDLDGIVHVVPNGEIRVSSNYTKEWSRVNLNISVAYGENLDRVIAVINLVGKELADDPQWKPLILKAPQVLRVDDLGASGIDIKILGDTIPIRQWDVMGELRKRLKDTFDKEGIEIPWPHTKVYFGNSPPPTG
ncbi:MAG: mechanosensitive ion channel family protein [Chloroflexi bacterium]|nr:mechanosensitive ion channel family protein [Chloroflexota bacterium]